MSKKNNNREAVLKLGNLLEAVYDEIDELPVSDVAKTALMMVTMGDIIKREGGVFYFYYPRELEARSAAR